MIAIPLGEGFGLNTNLLETNIINLAVVIGVLVYFGGDVLKSLLNTRKENILKSLKDAEEKFKQTELNLANAKNELALANKKAEDIKVASKQASTDRCNFLLERAEQDIVRLQESQLTTVKLEEEKILQQLCVKLSNSSLEKAEQKLTRFMSRETVVSKFLYARDIERKIARLSKA